MSPAKSQSSHHRRQLPCSPKDQGPQGCQVSFLTTKHNELYTTPGPRSDQSSQAPLQKASDCDHLRAIVRKEEVKINVLDALYFSQQAWHIVSQQTIANCYHHAGFKIQDDTNQNETPIDDEDPLDDLPLARLIGSASTMTE